MSKNELPESLRDKVRIVKEIVTLGRRGREDYDILIRWILQQKKGNYAIAGFLSDKSKEYKSLYPTFERRLRSASIKMGLSKDKNDKKGFDTFKKEHARLRVGKVKATDKHPTLFIEKHKDAPIEY